MLRASHQWRFSAIIQPSLTGRRLSLLPLFPNHFESLCLAASDPLIWEQHPARDRYMPHVFAQFFAGALTSGGALVVRRVDDGRVIGTSRYYDANPADASVAIGFTFLTREHWCAGSSRADSWNYEMKDLMMRHAMETMQARRVLFHIGHNNKRSRKALEKIGGQLIGVQKCAPMTNVEYAISRPPPPPVST